MSMTMAMTRSMGEMTKDKLSRRYQNLLNLVYLQAEPIDGGGYRIPEKIFESIQTELDFSISTDETETQKLEGQIKRRYRQRNSYRFWKDFLDVANIGNDVEAKEYLMKIFRKLDASRHYGSMTHAYYALETMQLALDDTYGTNNLVLKQYKFLTPPKKKKKKKKAKKSKVLVNLSTPNDIPF